jgi:hypothetical protein
MNSISLLGLTGISQWTLFAGIAFILFGIVEKNEKIILGGQVILLLLGFFALYVLVNDMILVPKIIDGNPVQKEFRVLSFYKGIALFTGLTVISLMLKLLKIRFQKTSLYILVFFALMLFFMVFNIQQTPN